LEEISAPVELTGLIGVFHIAKTDAPSMIGIAYKGRLVDGARPSPGAEMLDVRVVSIEALPPLAFSSHNSPRVTVARISKPGPRKWNSAASSRRRLLGVGNRLVQR
jgi:hypothetical protein